MTLRKLLVAALLLASAVPGLAQQTGGAEVFQTWAPLGRLASPMSVTSSSSRVALPTTGVTVKLCNTGLTDAYVVFGTDNTVVASTTTGFLLQTGTCAGYSKNPYSLRYTHVAAITATSTTTIYVETGVGTVASRGGAGGSAVTPGGSTGQVQYNNGGAFGGISGWTTNGATALTGGASSTVAIGGATIGSNVLAISNGTITTGFLFGTGGFHLGNTTQNPFFAIGGVATGSIQLRGDAGAGYYGWTSGSSSAASADTTISRNAAGVVQFGTTAVNALGAWLAAKGTLTGGTLGDQAQVFAITATQPASPTGTQNAITATITSAGSASQNSSAFLLSYAAGYTGSGRTIGLDVSSGARTTGNSLVRASGSPQQPIGNIGISGVGGASTSGLNVGLFGGAEQSSTINVGVMGSSQVAANSVTNIGVIGTGLNTGTTPVMVGGFFSLNQTTVPTVSAALIADNGAQALPVALFRVAGTTAVTISSVGRIISTQAAEFGAVQYVAFTNRTLFRSPSDGVLTLSNFAETDFTRLQLGGITNLFPSIKRNGTGLDFRLADDSAYAPIAAGAATVGDAVGSTTVPSLAFAGSANTGFAWSGSSARIAAIQNGIETVEFRGGGLQFLSTLPVGWSSGAANGTMDTILARDAANILAQRNGVNAQTFRVYNTFTDASNYARVAINANDGSGVSEFRTEASGTGSLTPLRINAADLRFQIAGTNRWQITSTGGLTNLTGITLADGAQVFAITATQPASPTGTQSAILATITGAGTASQSNFAFNLTYSAGYTGSSLSSALVSTNLNAGTGSTLIPPVGQSTTGNVGVFGSGISSTSGLNVGVVGAAASGNINTGLVGYAQQAKASATNIGVVGSALNTSTSPVMVGGFFSLNQMIVPVVSAALIADNGSQAQPIFLARDNGTTVFTITDGGVVQGGVFQGAAFSSSGDFQAAASGGFYWATRGGILASADGVVRLTDNALTGFGRLQLGGTTSAFPAIKRSTTSLQARLADDSAFTNIQGKITTDTNYTAGAITDTGYLILYDGAGTAYKVPACLASGC